MNKYITNPYIFREYDIRGIVKEDFPSEFVNDLGKAFGTYIIRSGKNNIVVSGDIRPSTPRLVEDFSNGLMQTGINVINIGTVPTPVNYYSMYHLDVDGAVQITGSHNPSEYNGFKFSYDKSAFFGKQIKRLKQIIDDQDFEKGIGTTSSIDILDQYFNMLKNKIIIKKPMNAVIDCGNASACLIAPKIFKKLGISFKELFCEVDGNFPNHHPDPTEDKNLNDLIAEIKKGVYDFGVAFDGDADRVVAVDEKGNIIRSDILMTLFLPEVINKSSDCIVYDVKCSKALEEMICYYGGTPIMWKTGHSLIKQKMKELNVKFAGEMSGHIFFSDDFYGFDDAVYVSLRLAQLLSNSQETLSEMISKVPTYHSTPEIRINCKNDKDKFEITNKAIEYFSGKYKCDMIDGVRISYPDGWALVRSSNTQPVIVCRFESKTKKNMNQIKCEVLKKLKEFGEIKFEDQ